MHRVAEEGIAAHWKYKEGRVGAQSDEPYFKWLRQLLEWQQDVDPQDFINSLKIELYPEEIYCFTPGGELKELPRDATIVDFAYAVHTDVGHQCVGGRVNGKMAPLRHSLKNGDIVQILTQGGHKPSRDWLAFVKTSRARNKIRHFIQLEEKTRSVELGRKLFEKEARRFDINPKNIPAESWLRVATESGNQKVDDLLAAVGWGKLTARLLLGKLVPTEDLQEKPPDAGIFATVRKVLRPRTRRGQDPRPRCRRPARLPRQVLQPDQGRKDRRLHHARQGRVGPLVVVPQRDQPDVRPGAPDRRRVGHGRRPERALHGTPQHPGRGPPRHARRHQQPGLRHQHQHPDDGGDDGPGAGVHRDDRGDPGRQAPGQGHSRGEGAAGRAQRRAPRRGGSAQERAS